MKMIMIAAIAAAFSTPALAQTTTPEPAPTTAPDPSMNSDTAATTSANNSGAMPTDAAVPATGDYPMCSRTVTDHCTERSNAAGARLHSTPRPPRG